MPHDPLCLAPMGGACDCWLIPASNVTKAKAEDGSDVYVVKRDGRKPHPGDGPMFIKPRVVSGPKTYRTECGHCGSVVDYNLTMMQVTRLGTSRDGPVHRPIMPCPVCGTRITHYHNLAKEAPKEA
ncbi:hypothetical protein [Delftia phage PhiW-14]|uniref:Uncharacterized protein n=1 Tax=Delftia phage PhiW-14 TaxID=665032 RepID=C9DGA3_BPW14|nr:hypothetical protein DP-phiW-14_gp133 [Delftia phage PhiW-14]ACV50154.1 hypothetical protein [Delftia phage PhiW-14]